MEIESQSEKNWYWNRCRILEYSSEFQEIFEPTLLLHQAMSNGIADTNRVR